jgi:REP-associated tyrosine transposase
MMHFLITSYTIYFNKKHQRHGHLFQGRFKSVLIEAVTYAQELSRYIHLNPVRAEIVERPDEYPWSSYGCYQGKARRGRWLETDVILGLFSDQLEKARKAYVDFVTQGIGEEVPDSIKQSVKRGILGSEAFIARIKREYLGEENRKPDREKPQIRKLRRKPDLSLTLSVAERVLGPRNRFLVPLVIHIVHKSTALTLREIGEFFSLSVSGVSNARQRAQIVIASNAALAAAVEAIEREVGEAECGGRPQVKS